MVDHHVRHDAEGGSGSGSGARAPPSEAEKGVVDGDFVLIQREDAVEAIAAFVVEFLARHPRAANLSPAELSALLATALATIRQVGRHVYLRNWPVFATIRQVAIGRQAYLGRG